MEIQNPRPDPVIFDVFDIQGLDVGQIRGDLSNTDIKVGRPNSWVLSGKAV